MTAPIRITPETALENLDEIESQTKIHVNDVNPRHHGKFGGLSASPSLARSHVAREKKPVAPPAPPPAKSKPSPSPSPALRITPDYELYRIITDYEALQDGFLDRIDDLDTTQGSIPGFADGEVQKHLTKSSGRLKRGFGWESLGKMLEGTGLALVLVVDDARFTPIKEQLAKRRRINKPAIARIVRPHWLFKKKTAREMGKKRWSGVSDLKRKRLAKRAAKARWRKAKSDGALLTNLSHPISSDGKVAAPRECQMVLGSAEAEAQGRAPHTDAAGGPAAARSGEDIPA